MDVVSERRKPQVEEYMTQDVVTVSPDTTVGTVATQIAESEKHSGFPSVSAVASRVRQRPRPVAGRRRRTDLQSDDDRPPGRPSRNEGHRRGSRHPPVGHPEATRRRRRREPRRDHLERRCDPEPDRTRNPRKVGKLTRTLEQIHGVDLEEDRRTVALAELTPTQGRVYADELEGGATNSSVDWPNRWW